MSSEREANQSAGQRRPLPEPLLTAVAQTLEATSQGASETRQRAQVLLDEVARRGQEAGEEIARRGQEAGVEIRRRFREFGFAGAEEVDELRARIADLEARLEQLQAERSAPSRT